LSDEVGAKVRLEQISAPVNLVAGFGVCRVSDVNPFESGVFELKKGHLEKKMNIGVYFSPPQIYLCSGKIFLSHLIL